MSYYKNKVLIDRIEIFSKNMRSNTREISANINNCLQLFGSILIVFKMVVGYAIISLLQFQGNNPSSRFVQSIPNLRFLAAQEIVSIILHTLAIIFSIQGAHLAMKGTVLRKKISIVLLLISLFFIGIVMIFNITGAIKYKDSELASSNYYVLSIVTVLYLTILLIHQVSFTVIVVLVPNAILKSESDIPPKS